MAEPICFKVPPLDEAEIRAVRALRAGEAQPDQQVLVLALIINKLSRPHDITYVPGAADQSTFLAGRAFVGTRLLKILNVPVGQLAEDT